MSKKGRILSIGMVLFMVLSLVAVIPISMAGAVAGTIELDADFYSIKSGFDSVTISVDDDDIDIERSAVALFLAASVEGTDDTFTIAGLGGDPTNGADSIAGEDVEDEDLSDQANSTLTVFRLNDTDDGEDEFWVAEDDGDNGDARLGDADADGLLSTADVTVTIEGEECSGDPCSVVAIDEEAGTVTIDAQSAGSDPAGNQAPAEGETITVTYNFHEYDDSSAGNAADNSPMSGNVNNITADDDTSEFIGVSFADDRATVLISGAVDGGNDVFITFTYDVADSIADVAVTSESSADDGADITVDLDETLPGSGSFEGTFDLTDSDGLDDDDTLLVADGDTITATYSDADPDASVSASATVDLVAPTLTLVTPGDAGRIIDPTPKFEVEATDSGSGVEKNDCTNGPGVAVSCVDLTILETTVDSAKTTIVGGVSLEFQQAAELADAGETKDITWSVEAVDAVGNTTEGETEIKGSNESPYHVVIDREPIGEFAATFGFGVNDDGTARTRDDNEGMQLTFLEDLDGDSVSTSDFDVTGSSSPLAVFHAATLENTETFEGDGTNEEFTIVEFLALDTDGDGFFDDEYTVAVDGVAVDIEVGDGSSEDTVKLAVAADEGTVVEVTYTFDSAALVFLTIAEQDDDSTPSVDLVGEVSDVAGNTTDEDDDLSDAAADARAPTITVTLDSAVYGDPDGDADAEGTITITSSETLDADPSIEVLEDPDGAAVDVTGSFIDIADLDEITEGLVWEIEFTTAEENDADETFTITAFGTDESRNDGTSDAVEFTIDITAPALVEFTPGDVDADDDGVADDEVNQGLDDIVRAVADWGEDDTVLVVSTLEGTLSSITIDLAAFGDSGTSGTATLTSLSSGNTRVEVSVTAGTSVLNHIHTGSGDDIAGVAHALTDLDENGESSTVVEATLDSLREGDFSIVTHDAADASIWTTTAEIPEAVDVSANTFAEGTDYILGLVLAEGDYTWTVQVEDGVSNDSVAESITFRVVAPTAFTIGMEPGWNLISVPSRLDAASLAKVFGDTSPSVTKVRTWSSATGWQVSSFVDGAWDGDILTLKQGNGYWAFSESGTDVDTVLRRLSGIPTAPRPQALAAGWNLIGPQFYNLPPAADVDADDYLVAVDWAVAYGFDADPAVGFARIAPDGGDDLDAGRGYWVYLNEAGSIIP